MWLSNVPRLRLAMSLVFAILRRLRAGEMNETHASEAGRRLLASWLRQSYSDLHSLNVAGRFDERNCSLISARPKEIAFGSPQSNNTKENDADCLALADGPALPTSTKLQFTTKNFRDAPGLSDTAASSERRFGVEDLADGTDPGFAHLRIKARE